MPFHTIAVYVLVVLNQALMPSEERPGPAEKGAAVQAGPAYSMAFAGSG